MVVRFRRNVQLLRGFLSILFFFLATRFIQVVPRRPMCRHPGCQCSIMLCASWKGGVSDSNDAQVVSTPFNFREFRYRWNGEHWSMDLTPTRSLCGRTSSSSKKTVRLCGEAIIAVQPATGGTITRRMAPAFFCSSSRRKTGSPRGNIYNDQSLWDRNSINHWHSESYEEFVIMKKVTVNF